MEGVFCLSDLISRNSFPVKNGAKSLFFFLSSASNEKNPMSLSSKILFNWMCFSIEPGILLEQGKIFSIKNLFPRLCPIKYPADFEDIRFKA